MLEQERRGDSVLIDGVRCPCGCADLRVITPGTEEDRHDLIGLMQRPTPARGWCSIEHAQADGWPWLEKEKLEKRACLT